MISQFISLIPSIPRKLDDPDRLYPDEKAPFPKKGEKIKALITQYGWEDKDLFNRNLLNTPRYCDFLDFLYDSNIFYSVRAYETSLKDSNSELREGIKIINGQPHLLKEGQWTSWNLIIQDIQPSAADKRDYLLRNAQNEWKDCNYLYPNGLIAQTRYNWVEPVHQLNPNEMDRLYEHGVNFFKQKAEAPSRENCGFIQVFTGGTGRLGQIGHVGLRMIDKDGAVYSFGFETPNSEVKMALRNLFSALATYNGTIASRDFKEFSKFDIRRTTTIPVSEEKFHKALEKVKKYAETPLRFNMLHQNCLTFTLDILKTADIPVDIRTSSFLYGLYELLRPSIESTPLLGPAILKVGCIVNPIFRTIKKYTPEPICFVAKVITFIPCLILTIIKNTVFLIFGAGKQGSPPKEGAENETNNGERLTSFNRMFNHWTDFFKDDAFNMSLSYKFVDWQMEQGATEIYTFNGPQFYIVPSQA
ncbi:MAG TPA: DUF4105 domain-containing protein [Chlamydiales bacterium]|jgi:hypothetical protein|nr:DUF4105 domain-containing protein [Chlamydiales bacterium]